MNQAATLGNQAATRGNQAATLGNQAAIRENQATFFETGQFSPTGMTLIVGIHAVAIAFAMAWQMDVIELGPKGPIKIFHVEQVTPPAAEAKKVEPRPLRRNVYVPPSRIPQQQEEQQLTDVTSDPPLRLQIIDEVPFPLPPEPTPLQQSARAKGDVRALISSSDYPESARRNEEAGAVQARLAIGADGRVTGCSIVTSSGSTTLDSTTCRILKGRARFTPAKDGSGQAVSDSYLTPRIVWKIEGSG